MLLGDRPTDGGPKRVKRKMSGIVPILIGVVFLGGVAALWKKSVDEAKPSSEPDWYTASASAPRPGSRWLLSTDGNQWIAVHDGPAADGWAVAPAFGSSRREVIDKIEGKIPWSAPTTASGLRVQARRLYR